MNGNTVEIVRRRLCNDLIFSVEVRARCVEMYPAGCNKSESVHVKWEFKH